MKTIILATIVAIVGCQGSASVGPATAATAAPKRDGEVKVRAPGVDVDVERKN